MYGHSGMKHNFAKISRTPPENKEKTSFFHVLNKRFRTNVENEVAPDDSTKIRDGIFAKIGSSINRNKKRW